MPTDTYTTTTTWRCPAGVSFVDVECWGGGGAGGWSSGDGKNSGSGGGGGAYSKKLAIPVVPNTVYTVTVGAGGLFQTLGVNPTQGGDSWFSTSGTVLAKGGHSNSSSDGYGAAAGGASGSCIGDTVFSGGNGGAGVNGKNSSGGGGGSSAGTAANGNNGTAGAGMSAQPGGSAVTGGGAGGASGTTDDATAIAVSGSAPGGGGGGGSYGSTPQNSGNGAAGKVSITYTANYGTFTEHAGFDAKPGRPVRVNFALPTSNGMCGCYIFNERGGKIARDIVGKMGDVSFSSSPVWTTRGIRCSGGTGNLTGTNVIKSAFNPVLGNCTLRVIHVPSSWPGTYTCIVEAANGGTRLWDIFSNGSAIIYRGIGGSDGSAAANTLTMPVNTVNDLVFVRRLNDTSTGSTQVHYWYLNGKLVFKETGFSAVTWPTTGYTMTFGGNPSGGGSAYDGTYLKAQMWNRALHPTEVNWLYRNPWGDLMRTSYRKADGLKVGSAPSNTRKNFCSFGMKLG